MAAVMIVAAGNADAGGHSELHDSLGPFIV